MVIRILISIREWVLFGVECVGALALAVMIFGWWAFFT